MSMFLLIGLLGCVDAVVVVVVVVVVGLGWCW